MNIKQEILLLIEEEDLNTTEKIETAIKHGRISGVKSNIEINELTRLRIKEIVNEFNDMPSIYKNAAIKLAVKHFINNKNKPKNADPYLAYFNNRNKKEAKTTYKKLFTDFEEGKISDYTFEKKVNELFKDKVAGKEDADKLYEDSEWLMVIPKTFAASCKYGENTKWCTTSSKSMFDNYSSKSPLMIVINKKTNKKYQLHSKTTSFMDEKDKEPENLASVVNSFPEKIQELLIKNKFNIWNKMLTKANNVKEVQLALDKGADIHANNDYALRHAAEKGRTEVVKLLLDKGADIHSYNDSSLRYAANYGRTETVKLLLDKGANVHANGGALRYAANNGYTETVKLLLDKGADIHAQDDYVLRYAAANRYTEIVKLLLDKGANVHAKDDYALLYAANNRHTEVVKLLLDKGANVHAKDDFALRYAANNGHTEIVKLLLDKGADIHANGDFALQYAANNGYTKIVKLLKQYGKKSNK